MFLFEIVNLLPSRLVDGVGELLVGRVIFQKGLALCADLLLRRLGGEIGRREPVARVLAKPLMVLDELPVPGVGSPGTVPGDHLAVLVALGEPPGQPGSPGLRVFKFSAALAPAVNGAALIQADLVKGGGGAIYLEGEVAALPVDDRMPPDDEMFIIDTGKELIPENLDLEPVPFFRVEAEGALPLYARQVRNGRVARGVDAKMIPAKENHEIVFSGSAGHQADLFGAAEAEGEADNRVAVDGLLPEEPLVFSGQLVAQQDAVTSGPPLGEKPAVADFPGAEIFPDHLSARPCKPGFEGAEAVLRASDRRQSADKGQAQQQLSSLYLHAFFPFNVLS